MERLKGPTTISTRRPPHQRRDEEGYLAPLNEKLWNGQECRRLYVGTKYMRTPCQIDQVQYRRHVDLPLNPQYLVRKIPSLPPFRYLHQGHEIFPHHPRLPIFRQHLDIVDTRRHSGRGHAVVWAVRNGCYDLNYIVLSSQSLAGFISLVSTVVAHGRDSNGPGIKCGGT